MFGSLMNFDSTVWDDVRRLQREMDALFSPGWGRTSIRAVARGSFPAVNVGQTADAVQVYCFAPGLDVNSLNLSLERNLLTVSGERTVPTPEAGGERAGYHLQERFNGGFRRVIGLPDDVDPDKVSATYRNGVLTVSIARREAARPRQIQINA
ncbi:MAG: Hsp20/alpha crystallin family protein [Pseudomonadota bacterium]|nr:Hsp20/alpha crystallin family protein [Pseudomonadota bacterium]